MKRERTERSREDMCCTCDDNDVVNLHKYVFLESKFHTEENMSVVVRRHTKVTHVKTFAMFLVRVYTTSFTL